jgi:hypothetical protein
MMASEPHYNDWHAADWEELKTIWDGLAGEGRLTALPYLGIFRGE